MNTRNTFTLILTDRGIYPPEPWEFCDDSCAAKLFSDFPLDTRGRIDGAETMTNDAMWERGYRTVRCVACKATYTIERPYFAEEGAA